MKSTVFMIWNGIMNDCNGMYGLGVTSQLNKKWNGIKYI